ncbi:MAG: hypothetical protein LQ343_007736 [Gyalolechia ehrenbergii]|nr:MAG: hypothetical protein LQ343_007736 [Gyalolechia ehrenbergii]
MWHRPCSRPTPSTSRILSARQPEIASVDQTTTPPISSVTASSGSNIHGDTNIFFFNSRSAQTKEHGKTHEQGNFAILPREESSSRTPAEGYCNNQRQSFRKCLSLRLLWVIPILWLLLVQILHYYSSDNIPAPEGIQFASTDDKFASTLGIQKSIEAALESTQLPRTAKLHELSKQAATNRQDTMLSHRQYSSHLHSLFALNSTRIANSHSTLLHKTISTLLFYTWPWENTHWHNKRFALTQAAHLDDAFPALDAFSTYYSGNLSQWIGTMGQMSDIIATEHEATTGELNSFGTDPFAYIRELYYAHDSSMAAESSRTLCGLVCRTLKLLVPLLEGAQGARAEIYAFQREVREIRERCMEEKGWCDELIRILKGVPFSDLAV